MRLLYGPVGVGFAHGFCATSEVADVAYKLSSHCDPSVERGFAYNDPEVGIAAIDAATPLTCRAPGPDEEVGVSRRASRTAASRRR